MRHAHPRALPALEALEDRCVPTSGNLTWFATHISDPRLRAAADACCPSGPLTRNDMLSLFSEVEQDGVVSAAELAGLRAVVTPAGASALHLTPAVRALANKVVNGNPANVFYQDWALGNLSAGSPAGNLQLLVDKWFLGMDHPDANLGDGYLPVNGTLFGAGVSPDQVFQGYIGDCGFLAALQGVAARHPGAITSLFTDNGDGTYIVRLHRPGGGFDYVTVDNQLPTLDGMEVWTGTDLAAGTSVCYAAVGRHPDGTGPAFDNSIGDPDNVLWVALLEKACAQVNEEGWWRSGDPMNEVLNSYNAALAGIHPRDVLAPLLGGAVATRDVTAGSLAGLLKAWNAGQTICLMTPSSSPQLPANVVPSHAYALVGYNATQHLFILSNAWGIYGGWHNSQFMDGRLQLTWSQLVQCFDSWELSV
jgi:hypothetical protein